MELKKISIFNFATTNQMDLCIQAGFSIDKIILTASANLALYFDIK